MNRPDNRLSPETFAVLACAQAVVHPRLRERFRGVVSACASADRLCETAVRHGMVGHLHKMISADGDAAYAAFVRDQLAALYRVSAERALHQTAQLLRLLDELKARDIEAMPIKGPAWAERLYGDVTLRNWVDLDLVVRYEQAAAAREALLELGFRDGSPFNGRLLHRRTRSEGEITFHSADDDLLVDIHWQIGVGYGARALSGERLLARSAVDRLLGREVSFAARQDLLLVTCLHGARHRWDAVETLLGLTLQARNMVPRDWPEAMAAARDAGCVRRMTVAVAHACHVFRLSPPREVQERLRQDAFARALVASLGLDSLQPSLTPNRVQRLATILWTVGTEDSPSALAEHALLRALQPGPEDWITVGIPSQLDWLYYPLRPLRLAAKWIWRLPLSTP